MLLIVLAGCAQIVEVPEGAVVFANANVVSMVDEQVQLDQLVVIDGEWIHEVLPGNSRLPEGVELIDAEGRFLMPGLVDMHVHNWYEGEHLLFVANGVTTVRNLFGSPQQLAWRDEIAAGDRLGPTLYTSGPIVDGSPPVWQGSDVVVDAAGAASTVSGQVEAGYDFIKVYSLLEEDAWLALLAEAEAAGVPAVGHVPLTVTYAEAAASTQSTIEHLDGFIDAAGGSDQRIRPWVSSEIDSAIDAIEPAFVDSTAAMTAEAGVWNCATLVVYQRIVSADGVDASASEPHMAYVHPDFLANWTNPAWTPSASDAASYHALAAANAEFAAALQSHGAGLLAGTDAGNAWVVHGFALHEELQLFEDAGLTPYEALRTATVNPAQALGRDDIGTVEAGRIADLVLLEANPLDAVGNTTQRVGVMTRGVWHEQSDLQEQLDELADDYAR